MFSAILISSSLGRSLIIRAAVNETRLLTILKSPDGYPHYNDLVTLLSRNQPEVVLIDFECPDLAEESASIVTLNSPSSIIIGISPPSEASSLFTNPINFETISYPPDSKALAKCVKKAIHKVNGGVLENLIAFIPAKAGCGSSTVAMNTAAAVATHLDKKTLLLDADLRSGVLSVMLNACPEGSIQSALRLGSDLDPVTWGACLTSTHNLDMLLSSQTPMDPLPGWEHFYALLRFVSPRYDLIVADLPELVNPATIEIVCRARMVYLVCTQEMLAMKMAELRHKELLATGVQEHRISLIVNRWQKGEANLMEMEEIVGETIACKFPNDYKNVRFATIAGRPIASNTSLGKAFNEFANQACGIVKPADSSRWISGLRTLISKSS